MTAPREILPGSTYLITRRCSQRQFLLTPSPLTNELICYCLGLAAGQTGIQLHIVCFMSNHWHGVVTDPEARLPEFLERFHRLLARAQNAALGRVENLWSSEKPSIVRLVSDEDVLDKMAYVLANPTAAGLVWSPREWPGVISHRFGETWPVRMPAVFFDKAGLLPRKVDLHFVRPPIFLGIDDDALRQRLRRAVDAKLELARAALQQLKRRFVGAQRVIRQAFTAVPQRSEARRRLKPRFAAHDADDRAAALRGLVAFTRSYRNALGAWRAGLRDVIFPAGTYALRIFAGVACAPV